MSQPKRSILMYIIYSIQYTVYSIISVNYLWESNLGNGGNRHNVAEPIGDAVGNGGEGWVANVQRDGGHICHTFAEFGPDILRCNVENGWGENGARIVNA